MTATEARTATVRDVLRRARFWIAVLVVTVLVAFAGLVVTAVGAGGGAFAPDNAGPKGARALAQVLQQQGVQVRTTTRLDDAADERGTVLVDDASSLLTATQWRRLARQADRLVVVGPGFTALETLTPGVRQAGAPDASVVDAGCTLELARRAGAMDVSDATHSLRGGAACFAPTDGGGQLVTRGAQDGARIVLLADPVPLDNEHITRSGNAAVALGALGATATLTWYRPDPLDLGGTAAPTLQQLTPPWVTPVVVLLLATVVAAAFWRGRRFGPIVVERLPVAVRSRETVEGRARLYARSAARLRAVDALRIGTIGRVAPLLGLSGAASVDEVAAAACRLTGRPLGATLELLVRAEPAGDRDLMRLSDGLAAFEAAVRAAVRGRPTPMNGDS